MIEREKFYIGFSQTMSVITLLISIYLLISNTNRSNARTLLLILWIGLYIIDNFKTIKGYFTNNKEAKESNINIVENMSTRNYLISLIIVSFIKLFVPFLING